MIASHDRGRTWTLRGQMSKRGEYLAQATVVRMPNGDLLSFFRSRDKKAPWIFSARSSDDGVTWSTPARTRLPNNNCGIQATVLTSGALALAFNNQHNKKRRWPLSVGLSYDGGATWPYVRDVESGGNEDVVKDPMPARKLDKDR